ncbi:MAG TPA: porin [Prevotella sp.]
MKTIICMAALLSTFGTVSAQQETTKKAFTAEVHGTLRGKYEYQPDDNKGRFEVRNARFSLSGKVAEAVEYKAEIDLSDEGKIKMLDAYTRLGLAGGKLKFTIGQMRVPFTIDAHRSPHQQYFANRSFIAKQVGNVRDVGATVAYNLRMGIPVILEAGMFNGSGLTNQKDYWTNQINFSAKAQMFFPGGLNLTLSAQKIKPENVSIMMYDAGAYYHRHGIHAEVEYLFKHYADGAFRNVSAVDVFGSYNIALRNCFFSTLSPLVRYDFMSNHSNGLRYDANGKADENGSLIITDHKRHRLTGGITLSIAKPFISDIRLNYEKYFYPSGSIAKVSEKDKLVIEVMTRF